MGISIDHEHASRAWVQEIGGVSFPLLCDFWPHGEIAKKYGVFDESSGRTERAIFIIDKDGVVRYIDVHEIGEEPDVTQILEEVAKL